MADRIRTPRRRKEWRELPGGDLVLTADAINLVSTGLSFTSAETVLRIRGEYLVVPTAGGTYESSDIASVSVGIGMFSQAAVDVGGVSLPGPLDDVSYPWLWWHQLKVHFQDATPGDQAWGPHTRHVGIDTSAMRKTKPLEALGLVVQNVGIGGAPPLTVLVLSCRVLVALP